MTMVMVMIGVMTAPCETLKADGVGAGQQLGNMLLPIEHACEEGIYNIYHILYYIAHRTCLRERIALGTWQRFGQMYEGALVV